MILGIDFDGTIVEHRYPQIGNPVPNALKYMRLFNKNGIRIILCTMRGGKYLQDAVDYLTINGIELFGINENIEQSEWTDSKKIYANRYIDDAAIGCPLIYPDSGKPYVNWEEVIKLLSTVLQRKGIQCQF